jgi:F-type H+-transporting ATPase subunit b
VLHELLLSFEEIAAEILHEFSAYPVRMAAEFVQFILLLAIIWVIGFGWGKRKGFVANMLSERAERTTRNIEIASHVDEDLAAAEKNASERLETAKVEARCLVDTARAESEESEAVAREEANAEARRITARAKAAMATESEEMQSELREQLVSTVAQATRSILSEKMSVAEQRTAIEAAILASLGADETTRVSDNGARAVRVRPATRSGVAS